MSEHSKVSIFLHKLFEIFKHYYLLSLDMHNSFTVKIFLHKFVEFS
jgi:hypothetical protein